MQSRWSSSVVMWNIWICYYYFCTSAYFLNLADLLHFVIINPNSVLNIIKWTRIFSRVSLQLLQVWCRRWCPTLPTRSLSGVFLTILTRIRYVCNRRVFVLRFERVGEQPLLLLARLSNKHTGCGLIACSVCLCCSLYISLISLCLSSHILLCWS